LTRENHGDHPHATLLALSRLDSEPDREFARKAIEALTSQNPETDEAADNIIDGVIADLPSDDEDDADTGEDDENDTDSGDDLDDEQEASRPLAAAPETASAVASEQPEPEAERPAAAPATDTVPTAPTETSDDETEPDEEEDLEPTSEETLTNAIESIGLLLDTLFDEEIIYELAEVDLDKRDAFFLRLRAEFNKRMDAIERMPVLDKADAIAALPESVKAYFRMHGRVSNCDIRWYMNRFPAFNKLEDSERRAIADKLIRDMLQRGELIKVKSKRDVYEIATETAPSAVEVA
jgi:hypothetical protein